MSEQISKISKEVQKRVKEIAEMGGSKRKIDTEAEYKELSNLLSGQSGANAKFVREKMTEYENFVKEKEEQAFLDKVSEAVKKFVADVKSSFGDEDKIDSDEEAGRLIKLLPNTNGDLSNEDLEYIHRALAEGGYDVNAQSPVVNDAKGGEVPDAKEEVEPDKGKETEKPVAPKVPTKPTKPKTPKTKPQPKPQPKPEPKEQPKVMERDAIDGTTRGRKFAEEAKSRYVNNGELARQLKGVNSKNAYDFFQQVKAENNGRQNIVYKTLVRTSDRRDQLNYRNFLAPIKSLLMQAKDFGLEKSYAYQSLEKAFKDIARVVVTPNADMDPDITKAMEIDFKIDELLKEMGKVVH